MNDKITVIVPAYNIENYISNTLDSILAQTYSNIEIIVVNDGSTDSTKAIIDKYAQKDNRVKPIHKENGGVTSARLSGVKAATGKWIGFVDGDDYIEPTMFEHLLNNALKYNADISHCGYQMVFPSGKIDYYYNTGYIKQQNNIAGLIDLIKGNLIEPGLWNKLFKISLFDALLYNNIMDLTIKNTEDLLMNYYLFKQSNCSVYEDITPYHYILRKNSAATSKVNRNKLLDPLRVTKAIMNDAAEPLKDVLLSKLTRQLINLSTLSAKENKELIVPIRNNSRQELKKSIHTILKNKSISKSLKCMSVFAAYLPNLYNATHQLYGEITGNNKKYDIN